VNSQRYLVLVLGLLTVGLACVLAIAAETGKSVRDTSTTETTPVKTRYSKSYYDITPLPKEEVQRLAQKLDPEAYRVTQKAGTEPPFCGGLLTEKGKGIFVCVVCGLPLYRSEHKFESGTGWPSFYQEFDPDHVSRVPDHSYGMVRTEIRCARCGAHLGHVFDDGPAPTRMRHCLNSAALKFIPEGTPLPPESRPVDVEVAYFAGGCFWSVEHWFQLGPGVIDVVSGYMQGHVPNPTYEQVCTGTTGHAESVKVVFDPNRISYRRLLEAFFVIHDPTQAGGQGPDIGHQYRSGIWYANEKQKREAEAFLAEKRLDPKYQKRPIVTELEAAGPFYPAENYHQDYIERTGRMCHGRNPWQ